MSQYLDTSNVMFFVFAALKLLAVAAFAAALALALAYRSSGLGGADACPVTMARLPTIGRCLDGSIPDRSFQMGTAAVCAFHRLRSAILICQSTSTCCFRLQARRGKHLSRIFRCIH